MFTTKQKRISLSGLLCGLSETHKAKGGKFLRLWIEHKTAIHVAVEDDKGKIILKDSYRYVSAARVRYDELIAVMS